MKKNVACLPFLLLFVLSVRSYAQDVPSALTESGGEYPAEKNDADHPCISSQQYEAIEKRCAGNIKVLGIVQTEPKNTLTTALSWPLKAANGLSDCSYYGIGAYVDHNTNAGAVTDYNCGDRTYDGHKGTDIGISPFSFYKMDHDLVAVIAAAAGTIIDKADGNFDRNCVANNLPANYVIIQHADGSRTLYWHMKKNSVTPKAVGQSVAAGEYLGIAGSSGSSSGPHLHFEVWSGSTASTRIDPYSGSCNSLNVSSWWAAQKPYAEPSIVKASVHTTDIVLPGCPVTETLNESSSFTLPFQGQGLPAGAAKFYIFLRNETVGMTASLSILNPDGSIFNNWIYSSANNYNVSWRAWTKFLPSIPGKYTFKTTYNGITCSRTFDIINNTNTGIGILSESNTVIVAPNPNNGKFTLEKESGQITGSVIEIFNLLGDKIFESDKQYLAAEIDISTQPNGIYFVSIRSAKGKQVIKVLKI